MCNIRGYRDAQGGGGTIEQEGLAVRARKEIPALHDRRLGSLYWSGRTVLRWNTRQLIGVSSRSTVRRRINVPFLKNAGYVSKSTPRAQHGQHLTGALAVKLLWRDDRLSCHADGVLARVLPAPRQHVGGFRLRWKLAHTAVEVRQALAIARLSQ
ncbi:MAG: hypothetical protein J2P50_17330 [Hyphomicrobiaceae bacterium]|nr:hypothetical protein [Hyphomicrobiaceae bacterium]